MDIPGAGFLGRVDIRVGVDPNNREVQVQSLADSLLYAGDGADGDAVVAAEGEDAAAGGGLLVGLRGDGACGVGDGEGVEHGVGGVGDMEGRVRGGESFRVRVDFVVVVDRVA